MTNKWYPVFGLYFRKAKLQMPFFMDNIYSKYDLSNTRDYRDAVNLKRLKKETQQAVPTRLSNVKWSCFMATFWHSDKLNKPNDLQR